MKPRLVVLACAISAAVFAAPATQVRDPVAAPTTDMAAPSTAAVAAQPPPFPLEVDVRFDLTDQTGRRRTPGDFHGRPWLVFFGYARCTAICSVALPRMAEALDLLDGRGVKIDAVMITVDPECDTPEAMAAALPGHHPSIVGLTGPDDALAEAREAFHVEVRKLHELPDGAPVIAHGAFIWLIGPDGEVEAALPPLLGTDRIAEIVSSRL
jgi:protein SCO1